VILPEKAPRGKPERKPWFLPSREEGLYIQYLLKSSGYSYVKVAGHLGINAITVFNVVAGHRRSSRVQSEIARILGKHKWEDVVFEARSVVTGRPEKDLRAERFKLNAEKDAGFEVVSAAFRKAREGRAG